MNCPFCQDPLTGHYPHYECNSHLLPITFSYGYSKGDPNDQLEVIQFYDPQLDLDLMINYRWNRHTLFPHGRANALMKIKGVPDLTPENASLYISKLKKLVIFT
jgi:hypothetical protein